MSNVFCITSISSAYVILLLFSHRPTYELKLSYFVVLAPMTHTVIQTQAEMTAPSEVNQPLLNPSHVMTHTSHIQFKSKKYRVHLKYTLFYLEYSNEWKVKYIKHMHSIVYICELQYQHIYYNKTKERWFRDIRG